MNKICLLVIQTFISSVAIAQTQQDIAAMTAARAHGERIANIGQNQVISVLNQGEALNEMKKLAGYDEQKVAEIKGRGVDLGNSPTLGNDAKEESPIFSQDATEKREKLLDDKYGFRKDKDKFAVDNKGYLDKAKQKIKDASGSFDFIRGKYKNCEPRDEVNKYQTEEVCDEYYDVKMSGCIANQVVEIDPKYTYQCTKKREEKQKVCTEVLTAKCNNEGSNCDSGGVTKGSISSDMQFTYNYPELIVGTISDNYWSGNCEVYDRATSFEVTNLAKVTEFRITQVGFDDYLWIKVNGHTVYVGPDGGSGIELGGHFWHTFVSNGAGRRSCERKTNWIFNVDIDLKPYLHEGQNTIWTRVIVAGRGEGWMRIRARQQCCNEWIEHWESKCELQ